MISKLNWQETSPEPDDDLLAHAINYAAKINDPRLPLLIELNGYDEKNGIRSPRWGWRSYSFTMKALNSLGRGNEAIELGMSYLDTGIVDGDTNKVLQDLAAIMRENGKKAEATQMLESWLLKHPYAPAPQILTSLLEWEETKDTETIIAWATRGLRDLAEEQASSSHGNFFYRRALARDKRALDAIESPGKYKSINDICSEITKALSDYDMARELDLPTNLYQQIEFRKTVLIRAAKDCGCGAHDTDDATSTNHGIPSDVSQALHSIVGIISDDNLDIDDKVEQIKSKIHSTSASSRKLLMENLLRISQDDDAPTELRNILRALFSS